jgi:hypothetical protein
LPPNVLYERWPSASNPQSTSAPVANGGIWAATSPFRGCAACRPPANPALKADLSRGPCKRDLFSAEAMRRLPGAVLERVRRHSAARPRGMTHAILNTGHGTNPRPPDLKGPCPCAAWGPPFGAQLRGQGIGPSGYPMPAALTVNRPSDAAWKQRLGLITLIASGDDTEAGRLDPNPLNHRGYPAEAEG